MTSVVLSLLVWVSANPSPNPDSNASEKRLRYLASRLDAMVVIKEKENTLGLLLQDLSEQVSEPEDRQKNGGFEKRVNLLLDVPAMAEILGGKFEPEVFQIKFIAPMKVTLRTALERIAVQLPSRVDSAGFVVRNDCIELLPSNKLREELRCPYGDLRQLLVGFFDKVPLETAFKELERKHNRNIVLSPLAEKAQTHPITARLVNVPFDTAVDVLAELADLKVVRKANVYFVTTKEHAGELTAEEEKRLNAEKKRYEELKAKNRDTVP